MSTLAPTSPRLADAERLDLARRVRLLSWASLAYMSLEGGIAILAGVTAGSVALVGFGLDSAIEGFASAIIVWRFTGHRVFSDAAETRAQKLVAIQFFLLAPYVGYESVAALVTGERPDVSWVGIGLAASSAVVMPFLGITKERLADRLGSAATKGEGRQNMLCAYSPGRSFSGCSATPSSAPGGWMRRSAFSSPAWRSRRAARPGGARAAASAIPSARSRPTTTRAETTAVPRAESGAASARRSDPR